MKPKKSDEYDSVDTIRLSYNIQRCQNPKKKKLLKPGRLPYPAGIFTHVLKAYYVILKYKMSLSVGV